jgi:hypothetical protein
VVDHLNDRPFSVGQIRSRCDAKESTHAAPREKGTTLVSDAS